MRFALLIVKKTGENNIFAWSSALAYSWLFAVFPFIIFALSLLPYLPENAKAGARGELNEIMLQMPQAAYDTIAPFVFRHMDQMLTRQPTAKAFLSIGLILTLWAASGGTNATMGALDRCYNVAKVRPWWKKRLIAVALTVVIVSLILSVIILIPIGTLARRLFLHYFAEWASVNWPILWLFDFSRWILSLISLLLTLSIFYHFGISAPNKWRWVTPGSVFCIATWVILGFGLRYYITRFSRFESYGAVGGVAVLLLMFYLNAVALLVGAQINNEMDRALQSDHPPDVQETSTLHISS